MIRIDLNLQTGPQYDRRFWNALLATAMAVLLVLTIAGVVMLVAGTDELQRLRGEIATLDRQREAMHTAVSGVELLRQQRRTAAINAVLERRSRQPWIRRLDELERLLPERIALTGLAAESGEQRLVLQGRAGGFGDLQRLLESLSRARLFADPRLVSHTAGTPAEQEGLLTFTVSVKVVLP